MATKKTYAAKRMLCGPWGTIREGGVVRSGVVSAKTLANWVKNGCVEPLSEARKRKAAAKRAALVAAKADEDEDEFDDGFGDEDDETDEGAGKPGDQKSDDE